MHAQHLTAVLINPAPGDEQGPSRRPPGRSRVVPAMTGDWQARSRVQRVAGRTCSRPLSRPFRQALRLPDSSECSRRPRCRQGRPFGAAFGRT
jgi:hypothetical protein